jgi:tetratricopeptide (TPR) repeat protein
MDLDYLVDGTVSRDGQDIEIGIRLLDLAEYARPIWSARFDLAHTGLHRLNELVTAHIVRRVDPVIPFIEGLPDRRGHYAASGVLLRALPMMFSMDREKFKKAGQLIQKATEIDPGNSTLAAWAAYWHHFNVGMGWTRHTKQAFATVQGYALRAIKLDPENAEALGVYGHYCSLVHKDFDTALHCFNRSLRLNPNSAFTWGLSGSTYSYIGEPEIALQHLDRYHDLAPLDPHISWFEILYLIAYVFKGDYERAVTVGQRAVKAIPDFVNGYKPLIASLGHLGRRDEAKPYVDRLLALEPNFTVERFGQVYPIKKTSDRRRYMEGLRLAGIPAR